MTSISGSAGVNNQNILQQPERAAGAEGSGEAKKFTRAALLNAGDSVEISQEARDLLENSASAGAWKPWSFIEYETALVKRSEEGKEFGELMKSVKTQKSDLMSQINDIFKRNGISRGDYGKVKIEVDSAGKIVVGGVKDAKTAKAVENALNADKTLGKKLLQYQHDEKELSKQIKEYTGCSLYELTMTQKGDVNERIRGLVEEQMPDSPPRDEDYQTLFFLGENLNHVVGVQDIYELGFQGAIDFSGEINTLAEPERNIKNELEAMHQSVQEEFDRHNAEVTARMEAAGIEMTAEMKAMHLLNAANVRITVDNLGGVTMEGSFSANDATNKKGEEIVRKQVFEMLNDTEDNSYHLNVFTSASNALIQRMTDDLGDEEAVGNARVTAEITGGVVGDIRVSSPQTEAGLEEKIEDTVNGMIRDSGITLPEALEIEVDETGRIRATNLVAGAPGSERIQALLDRINADIGKADSAKGNDREVSAEEKISAWVDGVAAIADLNKVREGKF